MSERNHYLDCKHIHRQSASFGSLEAACARVNNLQVCNQLVDCDGNPLIGPTDGCFIVEGAATINGPPVYGTAEVCHDEVLRFYSQTIDINVTDGSAFVGLEVRPSCFDAIVNGVDNANARLFLTIEAAVSAGHQNICVVVDTTETVQINLSTGPVRLFYHPGVVTTQGVSPLFTSPGSEILEIQHGTFVMNNAGSFGNTPVQPDVLFGQVRAKLYNCHLRGNSAGRFDINTLGYPVLLNACVFDSPQKPDMTVWGNIRPDANLVSSVLNCEFYAPSNRLVMLGSNIHVDNCHFDQAEIFGGYAETGFPNEGAEDVQITNCSFNIREVNGASSVELKDIWATGDASVMYSLLLAENSFRSVFTGTENQAMISSQLDTSGSKIINNVTNYNREDRPGDALADILLSRGSTATFGDMLISGNTVRNIIFGGASTDAIRINSTRITNNFITGELRFGTNVTSALITRELVIANNIFRTSVFKGFIVTQVSTPGQANLSEAQIIGNHFDDSTANNINIDGDLINCAVTGNRFAGLFNIMGDVNSCRFSDNKFGGGNAGLTSGSIIISGNCQSSQFSNNSIVGHFTTARGIDVTGTTSLSTFTGNLLTHVGGGPGSIFTGATSQNNLIVGNRVINPLATNFAGTDVLASNQFV